MHMRLPDFIQRIPLWLLPVLIGIGLGLTYVDFLIGHDDSFYIGDVLFLTGFVVYLAAIKIFTIRLLNAWTRLVREARRGG